MATLLFSAAWRAPTTLLSATNSLDEPDAADGDVMRQLVFVGLFTLAIAARLASGPVRFKDILPPVLSSILAWCWISVFWAYDPLVALRRAAFASIVVMTVASCVSVLSYRQLISRISFSFWLLLAASFIAVLLFPGAVHPGDEDDPSLIGLWRGVFDGKNEAGAFAALAIILFLNEAMHERSKIAGVVGAPLAATLLWFSYSKTSGGVVIIALAFGQFAAACYSRPRLRRIVLLMLVGCGVPAAILAFPIFQVFVAGVLDDPTAFSGRAELWAELLRFVGDNPLLGSGFGSFWGIGDASPIYAYASGWTARIYSAHSGYLAMAVETGLIGLVICVACVVVYPCYMLLFRGLGGGSQRSTLGALLCFGWLRDFTETSMLDRANFTWLIMVIALSLLCKYVASRPPMEARR